MGPKEAREYKLVQDFKLYVEDSSAKHPDSPEVVDMIAHYLKFMYGMVQDYLQRVLEPEQYHSAIVKYCITVPAGWGPHHNSIMRQAAVQAGYIPDHASDRLLLLSKHQAAMFSVTSPKQMTLRAHENLMIVDAGSSVVEVTTYEVVPGEREALTLKEIAPPNTLLLVS
jgi:hypothetical protein